MQETKYLSEFPYEKVRKMTEKLPLFCDIYEEARGQYVEIMKYCRLYHLKPNEEIIKKGDFDYLIYFMVKGECEVYAEESDTIPINMVREGDMFGELSGLLDKKRTASVLASPEGATVLGLDAAIFNSSNKETLIQIPIRILFHRALQKVLSQRIKTLKRQLSSLISLEGQHYPPGLTYLGKNQDEECRFYEVECKKMAKAVEMATLQYAELSKTVPSRSTAASHLSQPVEEIEFSTVALNQQEIDDCLKQEFFREPDNEDLDVPKVRRTVDIERLLFLVVDNDESMCVSMEHQLKELGVRHIEKEDNGKKAWQFVSKNPHTDVVLCGADTAEMLGFELLQLIRTGTKLFSDIVFIIHSQHCHKQDLMRAIREGVSGYLLKPFTTEVLYKHLEQGMEHVRGISLGEL